MITPRRDKIKFVNVVCKDCGFDQVLFMRATTKVKCFKCDEIISMPKGGKCELVGAKITEILK